MIGIDVGQVGRFGVVGVGASVTHLLCALGLMEFGGLNVYAANLIAFVLALAVSYIGHHRWTFRRENQHGQHLPRFAVVAILGFVLNQAIIFLVVGILAAPYWLGIVVVVVIVPPLVYGLCRIWAFAVHAS